MQTILGLALLLGWPGSVAALELFGVALESSQRDELRDAAKQAGLQLIREGGEDNWFDVYDSASVMPGSTRFYLGFVKQDQRFAFAEYEFQGLNSKQLQRDLSAKYGPPEALGGRYLSDRAFRWQRDGIVIKLSSDWRQYKTRLSYVNPDNMVDLLSEQASYRARETAEVSLY